MNAVIYQRAAFTAELNNTSEQYLITVLVITTRSYVSPLKNTIRVLAHLGLSRRHFFELATEGGQKSMFPVI